MEIVLGENVNSLPTTHKIAISHYQASVNLGEEATDQIIMQQFYLINVNVSGSSVRCSSSAILALSLVSSDQNVKIFNIKGSSRYKIFP
jgi:hypothetical protein